MEIRSATTKERRFLPQDLKITRWKSIAPYLKKLLEATIDSPESLYQWLLDANELDSALREEAAWRFIRMTCNTQDAQAVKAYQEFVEIIYPKYEQYAHKLIEKYYQNPYRKELKVQGIEILNRWAKNEIELFREENIKLKSQLELKAQQYNAIQGAMTIENGNGTLTMQQANLFLESRDRKERKHYWELIMRRRSQDKERLDQLMDEMIALRHQIAQNAGFENYAVYRFKELGRFDYTQETVNTFREAVHTYITPLLNRFQTFIAKQLNLDALKPWDLRVDIFGKERLRPFSSTKELIQKTISVFSNLHPLMGEVIQLLDQNGLLDLDSRVGKAPGGYNYTLYETGLSFIFMNAVGSHRDMVTMMHEGGHAVHSYLVRDYPLNIHRDVPSEIAELASMAMELLSMEQWNLFYQNKEDLQRAYALQLYRIISTLCWICVIDAFQYWLYTHPNHSHEERHQAFIKLYKHFYGDTVDWSGYEDYLGMFWQKQLHIFEIPFYYIEYGFAQIGAVQVWMNYLQNPKAAVEAYMAALRLGYTKPIPEVYAAANVRFEFTPSLFEQITQFLQERLATVGIHL